MLISCIVAVILISISSVFTFLVVFEDNPYVTHGSISYKKFVAYYNLNPDKYTLYTSSVLYASSSNTYALRIKLMGYIPYQFFRWCQCYHKKRMRDNTAIVGYLEAVQNDLNLKREKANEEIHNYELIELARREGRILPGMTTKDVTKSELARESKIKYQHDSATPDYGDPVIEEF